MYNLMVPAANRLKARQTSRIERSADTRGPLPLIYPSPDLFHAGQDFVDWLVVGIHLPVVDEAVHHDCLKSGGNVPCLAPDGAARLPGREHGDAALRDGLVIDCII